MTDIEAINRRLRIAVLSDGRHVPVTGWMDAAGEDCAPEAAVACVAGADGVGWWSVDLAGFGAVTVN